MNDPKALPFLVKLAEIFRNEGDQATADALDRQGQMTSIRTLGEEDQERVCELRKTGVRLDKAGAHDEAEEALVEVLCIVESALGPSHLDIVDDLNALARCRLNKGDFGAALNDYSRLFRLVEGAYGRDNVLTKITDRNLERCRKGLGVAVGMQRLAAQMSMMLRQVQRERTIQGTANQDRMRHLAARLLARGRQAAAVHLYEVQIAQRLCDLSPEDELAMLDIRQYALDLRQAGELARSAKLLGQVVGMRNLQSIWTEDKHLLLDALVDLADGLSAAGEHRSAQATIDLADVIAKRHGIAPRIRP